MARKRRSREWPTYFPGGGDCPPLSATPLLGPIFRIHVDADSWRSPAQKKTWKRYPECQRASLSCFLTAEDAQDFLGRHQQDFPGGFIVSATLGPYHGVIRHREGYTDSHSSVWLRRKHSYAYLFLFRAVP